MSQKNEINGDVTLIILTLIPALLFGTGLLYDLSKYHKVSRNPDGIIISDFGEGVQNVETYKLLNVKKMAVQPTSVALPPIQVETQDHYILEIENINIFRFCDYSKVMKVYIREYPDTVFNLSLSNYYAVVAYGPSAMRRVTKFCGNDTDSELLIIGFPGLTTDFLMSREIRAHSLQSLFDSKSKFLEVANNVFLKVLEEHGSDEGTFKLDVSEMKVHLKGVTDKEMKRMKSFILAGGSFFIFTCLAMGLAVSDLCTLLERRRRSLMQLQQLDSKEQLLSTHPQEEKVVIYTIS